MQEDYKKAFDVIMQNMYDVSFEASLDNFRDLSDTEIVTLVRLLVKYPEFMNIFVRYNLHNKDTQFLFPLEDLSKMGCVKPDYSYDHILESYATACLKDYYGSKKDTPTFKRYVSELFVKIKRIANTEFGVHLLCDNEVEQLCCIDLACRFIAMYGLTPYGSNDLYYSLVAPCFLITDELVFRDTDMDYLKVELQSILRENGYDSTQLLRCKKFLDLFNEIKVK